jgi:hypothetical protein
MNNNFVWIIEQYVYDEYDQKLIAAIKEVGCRFITYDYVPTESNIETDLITKLKPTDIVIFHGGLQLGRKMLKYNVYPTIFLTLENYECFRYYGFYGNHLLNSDYMMMGLNDIERNKKIIFNRFNTSKIFIRPSNGYKSFAGQCISFNNFKMDLDLLRLSYGGLDLQQLILISSLKELEEEYRFVVVDGKIVSGTMYMDKDNRPLHRAYYDKLCTDEEAKKYAESLLGLYVPDQAFTMDIVRLSNGEYKLIEINSFNCASMYGGDYKKIVEAVNGLSYNEYLDVFGTDYHG